MNIVDDVTHIKSEVPSSPAGTSNKLDVVDKWRARVLYRSPVVNCDDDRDVKIDWTKLIERKMAVLKVVFPFLTERQLKGKAWKECGLNSVMGCVPRSGLPLKIKKKFCKSSPSRSRFASRQIIKTEPGKKSENCPYAFTSPKTAGPSPSQVSGQHSDTFCNDDDVDMVVATPTKNARALDLFQVSDFATPPTSCESSVMSSSKKIKKVRFREDSDIQNETQSSYITPDKLNGNSYRKPSSNRIDDVSHIAKEEIIAQTMSSDYPSTQDGSRTNPADFENSIYSNTPDSCQERQLENLPDTLVINFQELQKCFNSNPNKHTIIEVVRSPLKTHPLSVNGTEVLHIVDSDKKNTENANNFNQDDIGVSCNNGCISDTTPLQSTKIEKIDVKKRIVFETIAEVHHDNDNDNLERTQFVEETPQNQIIRPTSCIPNYNGYSVASSDLNGIEYEEEFLKNKNENNICITPVRHVNPANLNAIKLCDLQFDSAKMVEEPKLEVQMDNILEEPVHMIVDERAPNEANLQDLEYYYGYEPAIKYWKMVGTCSSPENNFEKFIVSLPSTPTDSSQYTRLPPDCLLSNYCCEQDLGYSKINLKPVSHRNYYSDKIIKPLKDYFDKVIPAYQSLKNFFEAPEKSLEQVVIELESNINDIIAKLDEDENLS